MTQGGLLRVICCVALMTLGLQADTVTVGGPAQSGTGNCLPFGCPVMFGLGTYQQVYSSSAFSGETDISQLTFFDTEVQNGGQPAGGTFVFSLSYTSASPGNLSLLSFGSNIGVDSQSYFSGTLPALVTVPGGQLLNISGTPFDYNPADGNLLLTITTSNALNGSPVLYLDQSPCTPGRPCPPDNAPLTSGAYFGIANAAAPGLVTQFTFTGGNPSAPEPGSLFLMLAGTVVVASRWRRRSA